MTADPTSGDVPGLPLPLSGDTRVYVIIGHPIAQVGSPRVFNAAFRRLGLPAVLIPVHVQPDGLNALLRGLREMRNLDGIVVTVPHKVAVMDHLDEVQLNGRRVGAVNAIKCRADGTWVGDNFDGLGCVSGLEKAGHSLTGRRVLLVGAGGAGSAVAHAMADAGVSGMRVSDIDADRARRLSERLAAEHAGLDVEVGEADPQDFDVLVNCTPLGTRPDDPLPVAPERITPGSLVVDVILKPEISPLLEAAAKRDCATQPGRRMLEGQAEAVLDFFNTGDTHAAN